MKPINIKFTFYLISLLFITLLLSCLVIDPIDNTSNTNYSASESFSFDIEAKNQKNIEIKGINGPITVDAKLGISTVKIWGERIVDSESVEDAEEHLKMLEVVVTDHNDGISVRTEQPNESHGRNYQVNYNVIIPIYWDVCVGNVNGGVEIDSLEANINVGIVNGDVVLTDIAGSIVVSVTNGAIYSKVALPLKGYSRLNTVNGKIQFEIPKTTSAQFAANLTNGTISVTNLTLKNMISSRNSISGVLGDGEGEIRLVTVNGSISANGF